MPKPHLVVSLSGHGFGHVAQTAPILNTLHELMPQLRVTVRSNVASRHLRSRIQAPFTHITSEGDIGMLMSSALDVCAEESRTAYREFHSDWDKRVAKEVQTLRELKADFVLSNVGYLPLAGAQQAGIPNAALCSLNWADIYRHYCSTPSTHPLVLSEVEGSGRTVDNIITAQIHDAYANSDAFLRATPGMAMDNLPNLIPVAPIAAVGANRRDELNRLLKLSPDEKLVLISMGGITSRVPIECWPRIDGFRWLVQESWQVHHPDAVSIESLQLHFDDLLASCDALICKPGYGSFVESTCCGVPVLYVNRPDWPESPVLIEWLKMHNPCREISRSALDRGNIADALSEILDEPQSHPLIPEGAGQVAAWLAERMACL